MVQVNLISDETTLRGTVPILAKALLKAKLYRSWYGALKEASRMIAVFQIRRVVSGL